MFSHHRPLDCKRQKLDLKIPSNTDTFLSSNVFFLSHIGLHFYISKIKREREREKMT